MREFDEKQAASIIGALGGEADEVTSARLNARLQASMARLGTDLAYRERIREMAREAGVTDDDDGSPPDSGDPWNAAPEAKPQVVPSGNPGTKPLRWSRHVPRRSQGSQRRLKLKWPSLGRWISGGLVFLTSADKELIGSRHERYRYATIGALMLLTAAQAWYSATLFFSTGLGRPFLSVSVFGIFFALFIVLIDRSIISYAPPIKKDKDGNLAKPRKSKGVLLIRASIAVAAALLMSEMILLQVFHNDISEQIQNDHLAAVAVTNAKVQEDYNARISPLTAQITAAQNTVNQDQVTVTSAQTAVNKATQAANCQEFGCPGITPGLGPGFRAAEKTLQGAQNTLQIDQQKLSAAQTQLRQVTQTNGAVVTTLNNEEQAAINAAGFPIAHADQLLSQEEAFWQLTVSNGTVLTIRLLLSLLILGVDLAPLLTKLTSRTVHDVRSYEGDYLLVEQHRLLLEKYRSRADVEVYQYAMQVRADRKVHDLEMATRLSRAQADAEATLYQLRLETNLRKLRTYHYYAAQKQQLADGLSDGRDPGSGEGTRGQGSQADRDSVTAARLREATLPWETVAGPADGGDAAFPQSLNPPDWKPAFFAPSASFPPDLGEVSSLYADHAATGDYDPPDAARSFEDNFALLGDGNEPQSFLVLDNRYVLHQRLPGADPGGDGIVWLAKDRRHPEWEWIVVKTMPSEKLDTSTTDYIQSLRKSERHVAKLADDHIGQILDRGDDRGFSYLVYPLYRPGSLATYCRQSGARIKLPWCAQVIDDVLSGLVAASAHNLVHLDLKPGNIVLDGDHARIIDWVLSRKWDASKPGSWAARGTPFFACPEQLINPQAGWDTPRADLYGVGATFYWLITGEVPYQREAGTDRAPLEAYRRLLVQGIRPRRADELLPGVPEQLGRLIDRWMSFNPPSRVPPGTPVAESAQAARAELRALLPALPDMTVRTIVGASPEQGQLATTS